jgi:prepilin peptidase CpaA
MTWIPLAFILTATVYDLRTREIPDAIPATLLGWSVLAAGLGLTGVGWGSLAGGFAIGLGLSVVFFAMGGLGGGDVKLLAALGAALGHAAIFPALFWTAMAGTVLALIALARGRRDFAYLPAIAFGLLIHLLWRDRAAYANLF